MVPAYEGLLEGKKDYPPGLLLMLILPRRDPPTADAVVLSVVSNASALDLLLFPPNNDGFVGYLCSVG